MVWPVQAGTLERLGESLVPAFLHSDSTYTHSLLGTCRAFATTQQVLELLFKGPYPLSWAPGWISTVKIISSPQNPPA